MPEPDKLVKPIKPSAPGIVSSRSVKLKPVKTQKKSSPRTAPAANFTPKLNKKDPDYYSKIGIISAAARLKRYGTQMYSDMAAKSHPRLEYRGGRRKKPIEILSE